MLFALVALGTGAFGSAFWLTRDTGPRVEAFAPAAAVVRDGFTNGDLIILVPAYATRGREYLGDLHPVAPMDPLREDFEAHKRFWVFGLFGDAERLRPEFTARGHRLVKEHAADGITVDLYEVAHPVETTFVFRDRLRSARVYHEYDDGRRERCDTWSDDNFHGHRSLGRWACPHDSEWFYVAPQWHRMGDHLRLCLWAHPPNEGRLVVAFPDVPMTGVLSGRAGHTLNGSLHAHAPIHLDVLVGETGTQRFTYELSEHWEPFVLTTPTTGTATVSFAVSTPNAGANHFCFDARMQSR